VIVFLSIVFGLFIRTPYSVIVYLLDAVYPIYVFCGVACITGALIGLTGKFVSSYIVEAVTEKKRKTAAPQVTYEPRSAKRVKKETD